MGILKGDLREATSGSRYLHTSGGAGAWDGSKPFLSLNLDQERRVFSIHLIAT